MSLLHNPLQVANQIEWYLDNRHQEILPDGFFLAAGNLSRQLLEQVLFVLAFYSRVPRNRYVRGNGKLRVANDIINALNDVCPRTSKPYLQIAREGCPRISKFAKLGRYFNRWRDLLNEPSHFRNPALSRRVREEDVRRFVNRLKSVLDKYDAYLTVAAYNEIRSKRKLRATLGVAPDYIPGVLYDSVVSPRNLALQNGRLVLCSPKQMIRIVPRDREVVSRHRNSLAIVQGSEGISISTCMRTTDGHAIDLSSSESLLISFCQTEAGRRQVKRRLKALGCECEFVVTTKEDT